MDFGHTYDEEPVATCDCRRCAIAERDRLRDALIIHCECPCCERRDCCDEECTFSEDCPTEYEFMTFMRELLMSNAANKRRVKQE